MCQAHPRQKLAISSTSFCHYKRPDITRAVAIGRGGMVGLTIQFYQIEPSEPQLQSAWTCGVLMCHMTDRGLFILSGASGFTIRMTQTGHLQ